jgi:hypothetical protein
LHFIAKTNLRKKATSWWTYSLPRLLSCTWEAHAYKSPHSTGSPTDTYLLQGSLRILCCLLMLSSFTWRQWQQYWKSKLFILYKTTKHLTRNFFVIWRFLVWISMKWDWNSPLCQLHIQGKLCSALGITVRHRKWSTSVTGTSTFHTSYI